MQPHYRGKQLHILSVIRLYSTTVCELLDYDSDLRGRLHFADDDVVNWLAMKALWK